MLLISAVYSADLLTRVRVVLAGLLSLLLLLGLSALGVYMGWMTPTVSSSSVPFCSSRDFNFLVTNQQIHESHDEFDQPIFFICLQVVADRGLELLSATFIFSVIVGATFLPRDPSDLELLSLILASSLLKNQMDAHLLYYVVFCVFLNQTGIPKGKVACL
jgi:hypothetical protein